MKGYLVKILVLLFALMLTLALFTACTKNNDGDKENISGSVAIDQTIYSYIVNEDGTTCTITAVEGDISADWVFPSSLDGYAVTIIGDYAFFEGYMDGLYEKDMNIHLKNYKIYILILILS